MTFATPPLAGSDLDEVLAATAPLWEEMRGERLFLTGGTGFFGCWLVETFLHANRVLELKAGLTVLTRDAEAFRAKCPHLAADSALEMAEGDVRSFNFPAGDFGFVIHAATEASARQLAEEPLEMLTTMLRGTERVLEFAATHGGRKLLLTSSGGVYGRQPAELSHVPEEYAGAPDTLDAGSVYGEGKRMSEQMCALHARTSRMEYKIARCFAFVGPHLPLDTHFAAGNFLRDALAGRPIAIASDGSSVRSYLYASDLAAWLWTILFRAPSLRAYNVGSQEAVDIGALAETMAREVNPATTVTIAKERQAGVAPQRYVPATARAQAELGLRQSVGLGEALRRTAAWHQLKSSKELS